MNAKTYIFTYFILLLPMVQAGTIIGTVQAQGKQSDELASGSDKYSSRKYKFIKKLNYRDLEDIVVYLDLSTSSLTNSKENKKARIVQENATFKPHVLPVNLGTTVEFPNLDNIYHNAFSFSEAKPFDLGLYKKDSKQITFNKPGKVDVFCSIHKTMHCIILVLDSPYFDKINESGSYRISDIPQGTYTLRVWHERMPTQEKTVEVPEKGTVTVNFILGITGLPTY